jgi:hypothetical protein
LLINTEKVQILEPTKTDKIFILYLPMNEIHELGLMYLNYEIISNGYKTIFLGESVPIDSLKDIHTYFDNLVFVTYMTVEPDKEAINDYLKKVNEEVIMTHNSEFWVLGKMTEHIDEKMHKNIKIFKSIPEVVNYL